MPNEIILSENELFALILREHKYFLINEKDKHVIFEFRENQFYLLVELIDQWKENGEA